jgi:hypothetical protein
LRAGAIVLPSVRDKVSQMIKIAAASALAALALAAPGSAGADSDNALHQACRTDVQKFCADTQPRDAVVRCMKRHAFQLSGQCRAAWKASRRAHAEAAPAHAGGRAE